MIHEIEATHAECDCPGCENVFRCAGGTRLEHLAVMRAEGWTFRKGFCRCPACGKLGWPFARKPKRDANA